MLVSKISHVILKPHTSYLGSYVMSYVVLKQFSVVECQNILYHTENVDGRIREIFKPVLAPIDYEEKNGNLSLPCLLSKDSAVLTYMHSRSSICPLIKKT